MLDRIISEVKKILSATATTISKFWKDCCDTEKSVEMYRARQYQVNQKQQLLTGLELDYDCFTNAVANCIRSNHQLCGLVCPTAIEDVLCSNNNHSIDQSSQGIVFRFEVKRKYGGLSINEISKGLFSKIPTSEIENELIIELPKFARRRGYSFSNLTVDDIQRGRVRIMIYGVTKFY